jgi:hypothetical protein
MRQQLFILKVVGGICGFTFRGLDDLRVTDPTDRADAHKNTGRSRAPEQPLGVGLDVW